MHSQTRKLQFKRMHPHKGTSQFFHFYPLPLQFFLPQSSSLTCPENEEVPGKLSQISKKLYFAFLVKDRDFQKNIRVTLMCVCAVAQSCPTLCESTDCNPTRLLCSWNSPGKDISYCLVTKPCELFVTTWTAACQASLSFTISQNFLKLTSIELVVPSNHLILCCPVLFLSSTIPRIRVFSKESALCIRWPKYWSFSFNISPSNEYSGLISFKMDWLDLLAV